MEKDNRYKQLLEWCANKGTFKWKEIEDKLEELGFESKGGSPPSSYNFFTKDIIYRYGDVDKFCLTFAAYFDLNEQLRLEEARSESKKAMTTATISIAISICGFIASVIIGIMQLMKMS